MLKLVNDMEFEITSSFVPNISKAEKLKIIEVTPESVVVQMHNSNCRGVFPMDNFQYWVKRSSLIHIIDEDYEQQTS
ncbi:hypothetical protein HHO41_12570 [Bacillus sp. DNRA2]|uniref:hypothetical protein n=1 Tax=Bacillus sp. DNRA2 TaxID=2723053 RepID=UPI00145E92DF|nr:hypothetical protein [Bacillus sp. DNRA2]NMD71133.1 hypothetical protein [Bacillus sp. DNRA2]